jgi:uncharacterized protein with PQ loop repeat
VNCAPLVAAALAVPQFVPQIIKVRASRHPAGVSWSWAAQTSINNAAWFGYFALSGDWTGLVPATATTLSAGVLALMLALRGRATSRAVALVILWGVLLVSAYTGAGRLGLGALLTGAFVLQVAPSIWSAYRTPHPTGVSAGTWLLILGELACWFVYGLHRSDPRLVILGATGVGASTLMLGRVYRTRTAPSREPSRERNPLR